MNLPAIYEITKKATMAAFIQEETSDVQFSIGMLKVSLQGALRRKWRKYIPKSTLIERILRIEVSYFIDESKKYQQTLQRDPIVNIVAMHDRSQKWD